MIEIVKLTAALTVISLIGATAIAITESKTKDHIVQKQIIAQENALKQILPVNSTIEELRGGEGGIPDQYWIACTQDRKDSLYVFKIISKGYVANINYLASVAFDGSIKGLTILEQSETPGLGSRIQEVISKRYIWNGFIGKKQTDLNWFTEQFKGISIFKQIGIDKSSGEWHKLSDNVHQKLVRENSVTAITGSTISTKAVIKGLENDAHDYLMALRSQTHD